MPPVITIRLILDDTQRIDPNIRKMKLDCDERGISEGPWEFIDCDASLKIRKAISGKHFWAATTPAMAQGGVFDIRRHI